MSFYECRLVLIPFRSNDLGAFPSGHTAFFSPSAFHCGCAQAGWAHGSRLDIVDDLLATATPRRSLA
jgi:hypothetical protein